MIENKTEYTFAAYKTFHHFFMFRRRLWWWIIVLACEVLGLSLVLLGSWLHGGVEFDPVLTAALSVMVFLLVFSWFVYPRLGYRSYSKGVVQHYRFEEDRVAITTTGQDLSAEQSLQYTGLYRVCETKGYFYLFLSSRQALIVNKNGFTDSENITLLRQWLQSRVKKYKLYH